MKIERKSSIHLSDQPSEHVQFDNESEKTTIDADEAPEKKPEKKGNYVLTFVGLQVALFMAALDSTIVSTALPRIGSDFNQMSIVSWVATAYILTFDAFQPLFAKFSDIFGRKWIMIFGTCMFLFGSLLCGISTSMIMLIISRAIAGIGAAGIMSMVFIIISDLVPLEKRGSYQGIINAVFALSSVFGPLIGGSFTDYVTWRWNFYINLPIGAVALFVLFFFLHMPAPKGNLTEKLKRIDYLGTCIVLVFATLFLLAMNFGGQTFPWKSAAVIVPLVLTVLLVALLVYVEGKVAEPLIPPRLLKNRSVASVLATNWFFGMAFFSMIYYLPIYFQVVREDSAMWSGIRLIPMELLISVFSTISGFFISKVGIYKPIPPLGMCLLTLSVGLLCLLDETTSFPKIYGYTVLGGAGIGLMFSSAIIALQASSEPRDVAVVTGLGNFSRILGGALGVAISSAILNSSLAKDLALVVPQDIAQKVLESTEYVRNGCPPQYIEIVVTNYVSALRFIWYVMTAMCGVGFLSSLFIKHGSVLKRQAPADKDEAVANTNKDTKIEIPPE
ncbi:major facilitator superfamily domain-containing protein [Gilbertella persicaria]|uniref:major facilitator superfamily domain-containing protein n=1 Tax=Gilbertella persicaria TaxID=101096 RepID=UPI002221164E|nr:major facilitator superfamily domain-containing protein [Gilbertella persicaria]KAI8047722.1 major facilitator superfamily domain-containing protein [Gilbertella persicaria]